jgi:LysR family transcriptional regulator, pca operon transcriptional activator
MQSKMVQIVWDFAQSGVPRANVFQLNRRFCYVNNRLRMRHIRSFLAIVERGSVTAAAAHIHSSQPALSRTIKELESIVGQKLFVRSGRGLTLTDSGTKLRHHYESAMKQIEAGSSLSSNLTARAKVSIGMLPNVARTLAKNAAADFKLSEPDIDLQLHWADVPGLMARLHNGTIDFVLGRLLGLDHMTGVSFEHLYTEPLIFVVNSKHPLAAQPNQVTLPSIQSELIVVPLPDTIIRRELDKFTKARGLDNFPRKIETVSFEFTRSFLEIETAVACIPMGAVRQEIADGRLVRLNIHGEELISSVGISYATGRTLSPEAQRFAEIVRRHAKHYG